MNQIRSSSPWPKFHSPMNIRHTLRLITLVALTGCLAGSVRAAILASDGSRADVQAKVDVAVDGDVVTIPPGSFTWTSGIAISGKGIHLRGAGSGRVVARS